MDRRDFSLSPVFVLLLGLLLAASPTLAESTIDCHCFRDRSYQPENPTAFDPYLLATTQNRLLAHLFDLPRKEIVRMKMSGTDGDDLWVGLWLGQVSGVSFPEIRSTLAIEGDWQGVVLAKGIDPETLSSAFMRALTHNASGEMARAAFVEICRQYFPLAVNELAALHDAGANLQEAVLAVILSSMQKASPLALFNQARRLGSWGRITVERGVSVAAMEAFLADHLRQPGEPDRGT